MKNIILAALLLLGPLSFGVEFGWENDLFRAGDIAAQNQTAQRACVFDSSSPGPLITSSSTTASQLAALSSLIGGRALVSDGSGEVISSTILSAEIDALGGVTSNIQSQLNAKASDDGDVLDIDFLPTNYTPDTTPTEVSLTTQLTSHLAGVDNVLATIPGGLTTGRALVSDLSGNVGVSTITESELDFLFGVGENIQTGLDASVRTGSDQGASGVGVFIQKMGQDLEFRSIDAGSSKITVVQDTNQIDIDVDESNIDHDALMNFVVDEHRDLDDLSTTALNLWSASKIQDELDLIIGEAYNDSPQTTTSGDSSFRVLTVADDQLMNVTISCGAMENDGASGGALRFVGTYRKDGAAALVEVGTTSVVQNDDCGGGANSCSINTSVASATGVDLNVNGSAGATHNWTCNTQVRRRNV